MKKIRFRAWDVKRKEMFFVDAMVFNLSHEAYRVWKNICEPEGGLEIDPKTGVLMQNTGLNDKNGVEIYESDIITYNVDGTNENTWKNKIIFENGCLIIENEDCPPIMDDNIYKIEIIGNVYENPKMLEGRK